MRLTDNGKNNIDLVLSTSKKNNQATYLKFFSNTLKKYKIKQADIDTIMYCSIVPYIDTKLIPSLEKYFSKKVIKFSLNQNELILDIDNPSELGSDLLADLYACKIKKYYPCLVIDLGTANKYCFLDKDCVFKTCIISPGMISSYKNLINSAALLKNTKIDEAKPLLKIKRTPDALIGGIIYTSIASIKGIAKQFEQEIGYKFNVVLTGGNLELIKKYFVGNKKYILVDSLIFDALNYRINNI